MTLLGVLIFASLTSAAAVKAPAVPCLSGEETRAALNEDWAKLQPLVQTVPKPVEMTYADLKGQPFLGYAEFTNPAKVTIHLSGTLCRDYVHRDELSVFLCHELGHAAGGAPYMQFLGTEGLNVAAEGQADFFVSASCLPALWGDQDNSSYVKFADAQPELGRICPDRGDVNERGLCMRVAMAAFNFALYSQRSNVLDNDGIIPPKDPGKVPRLEARDPKVVAATLLRDHPSPQCRLDTMLDGYSCRALTPLANLSVNPKTPMACGVSAEQAPRPACWYKN